MDSYAFYNGHFGKKEEISIPLSDRTLFFGDAVYDVAVGHFDKILWVDEHIERLLEGAAIIGISHEYTKACLFSIINEVVKKANLKDYLLYIQLSRAHEDRKHSSLNCNPSLLIIVSPLQINPWQPPMKLLTVKDKRYEFCNVKSVNLLPAVLASTEAEKAGFDEAVFIRNRFVTECAKSNISILKQGRLITHPKSKHILSGVTRAHLISVCKELNIPVLEHPFTPDELLAADEILVTSSTKFLRSVSHVNETPVGGKAEHIFDEIRCKLNNEYFFLFEM